MSKYIQRFVKLPRRLVQVIQRESKLAGAEFDAYVSNVLDQSLRQPFRHNNSSTVDTYEELWLELPEKLDLALTKEARTQHLETAELILVILTNHSLRFKFL